MTAVLTCWLIAIEAYDTSINFLSETCPMITMSERNESKSTWLSGREEESHRTFLGLKLEVAIVNLTERNF